MELNSVQYNYTPGWLQFGEEKIIPWGFINSALCRTFHIAFFSSSRAYFCILHATSLSVVTRGPDCKSSLAANYISDSQTPSTQKSQYILYFLINEICIRHEI